MNITKLAMAIQQGQQHHPASGDQRAAAELAQPGDDDEPRGPHDDGDADDEQRGQQLEGAPILHNRQQSILGRD